jgi:hypothetical protein
MIKFLRLWNMIKKMLTFNIVEIGDYRYRCVLGERYYFDFTICQLDLFGYSCFFENLKNCEGNKIFNFKNGVIGDIVSIRYSGKDNVAWILVRNGVGGELFSKKLPKEKGA